jgi:hypothetical protein
MSSTSFPGVLGSSIGPKSQFQTLFKNDMSAEYV